MRLVRGVRDRLTTPTLHINIMVVFQQCEEEKLTPAALHLCLFVSCQAYQHDDPRKYTVATVLVRVLAVNHFHPEFEKTEYRGFVTAGKTVASLVNTYGSKALKLHVQDQDFNHVHKPQKENCSSVIYMTLLHLPSFSKRDRLPIP